MTSELGGWVVGNIEEFSKKGDIGRDKVSICIRRVATITSLKPVITKEDTLWLWLKACLVQE